MRQHRAQDLHRSVNLITAQGSDHRRCAVKRHDLRLNVGAGLEQLGSQVLRAAYIDGAKIELARIGTGIDQQVRQRFVGRVLWNDHSNIEKTERGDRRKIFYRVERQRLEQPGTDCRAVRHQQQRVSVRLGLGDRVTRHHATRPGFVFNHDRLPQGLGHFLRDDSGRQISHAPGTEGHHDLDGS